LSRPHIQPDGIINSRGQAISRNKSGGPLTDRLTFTFISEQSSSGNHHCRFEGFRLFGGHLGIGYYYHHIAYRDQTGSCSVQAYAL